uniref:Tudor domain-containing protein n=1 Tax=Elaeophora elaphi TaxID=1147741 RepID=A0A0R3S459_9BILA
MVVLSVPSTLSNFDGEISHVVIVGSETLVIVKTTAWIENKRKIDAMIDCLLPSLSQIKSPSEIKSGEVYIINVKGSYERAYIIRRPLPDSYTIYLIDRGMQFEMRYGDVYEYPPELFEFGVFTCVCPVLVPHAEETVYSVYIGYKCKCIVESVSISRVLMGFVNGQLMVEIGGHYENLQDIISQKLANRPGSSGLALTKLHLTAGKHAGHAGETDDSFSFSNKSAFRHFFDRVRIFKISKCSFFGRFGNNKVKLKFKNKVGTLFYQRGFRQYVPEMLPIRVAVRFDKKDRMMNTFWVVNKDIFIAAERALKEIGSELWRFPPINRRGENFRIRDLPCILCAPSDSSFKFLYRGVPAQYDARTKRLSIFLVDFGWFKWVLPSDSDPVRNLPVAMIHCREDKTSPLHAKDLIKGTNCEIIIKGNAQRDVYTVDLVEPFYMSSRTDSISTQQTSARGGTALGNTREAFGNIQETLENAREALGNTREAEVLSSCRRLVTETCQRQLMTNVMMETLNIAN